MIRDGQPSPEQARRMARVFVIATLIGGLVVFLNVTLRSYSLRMQQQEMKQQAPTSENAGTVATPATTPTPAEQTPAQPTP